MSDEAAIADASLADGMLPETVSKQPRDQGYSLLEVSLLALGSLLTLALTGLLGWVAINLLR